MNEWMGARCCGTSPNVLTLKQEQTDILDFSSVSEVPKGKF